MNRKIALVLKGMAMGVAEVIPGVSGGTIAFITGIYEQLLLSIKAWLGPVVWRASRQEGLAAAWKAGQGNFLIWLVGGMVVGVVTGVFGVSHLLENYPPLIWAFFFGLIIASAIYVGKQVGAWGPRTISALVLALLASYFITAASPSQGPDTWWFVFLSGAIAISALILPGVSGSFILLLLGMYSLIIGAVKEALQTLALDKLILLGFFALGCLLGLATFSRVLSWMFKRYRAMTLAMLTGFMLGSLNKIWPWREVIRYRTNSSGEEVPFLEANVMPADYAQVVGDPMVPGAILMALLGFVLVFGLEWLGRHSLPTEHEDHA